ncbi:MAG: BrnA antitoxin family protein [Patescibacteria group bacterium]
MPIIKYSKKDIKSMPQDVLESIKQKVEREGINYSDNPEIRQDEWNKIKIVKKSKTIQISLRVDEDVLNYFKQKGGKYQTKINDVLRSYIEHHK